MLVSPTSTCERLRRSLAPACTVLLGALLLCDPAFAQTAENVAVVINESSPVSQRVGEYYVKKRVIPPANVLRIRTSTDESVDRAVYAASIEAPLAALLSREGLQDRVLYLVLTKGVPLRITGTAGANGTVSSVDSELTLLYRRMTGLTAPVAGRVDNPYYLGAREVASAESFTHRDHDIFLVTRLDAYTVDDVIALIDRAAAPSTDGRIVLDQQDKLVNRTGEDWLAEAAERLTSQGQGDRVILEKTIQPARDVSAVLGYYSWGSNDPRNRVRKFGMGFVPGALAATFVSSDARTFKEPPNEWVPADTPDQSKWFGGSPQSLIADLIREGATGVAGHVAEPYLQSTVRPEILFPAYLAGFNLVEAFYLSVPHLSWQTVVVGDPLCAPFRKRSLARSELEPGEDAETELPAWFSKRRVAGMTAAVRNVPERAIVLNVRGETLLARGNRNGARAAFEQATELAPTFGAAQLSLGVLYEQLGQYDAAIERYRRVVELQPRHTVALNNLAYGLSVRKNMPKEALPFAKQAVATAPQNPVILDTLAWIEHLLGDHASAAKTMAAALRMSPPNAEIRLHAAIIYAATGARAVAENELQAALKLNPALEKSDEVREVRAQLAKLAAQ